MSEQLNDQPEICDLWIAIGHIYARLDKLEIPKGGDDDKAEEVRKREASDMTKPPRAAAQQNEMKQFYPASRMGDPDAVPPEGSYGEEALRTL